MQEKYVGKMKGTLCMCEEVNRRSCRARPPPNIDLVEFFLLFSAIGLSSFGGGVSMWVHRALVERRGWLGESEFSAALALARIMPGVNIINLAVLIGHRLMGLAGAVAAVMGLLAGPSLVVIGLAILYRQFAGSIILDTVLQGMAASAAGLLIAMGLKSASRIIRIGLASTGRMAERVGTIVVLAAMFVSVGVFHFPTVPMVLCLAPCSWAVAFFAARNASMERNRDGG
jgi:chromate transporter